MKNYIREFPQPNGSVKICEARNGERLPTRYVKAGQGAKVETPKKEPKRVSAPKPERATPKRQTFYDCIHNGGSTGETTKHLCGGCPGGQVATLFTCELFGECLPAAWAPTPDTTARRCADCGRYEIALPPGGAGE